AGNGAGATRRLSYPSLYGDSALVRAAGDLNGDGYADLVVGDYSYNSDAGIVYVFLGSSAGPGDDADDSITGASTAYLGEDMTPAGDVNGDGYGDLLVSGYSY